MKIVKNTCVGGKVNAYLNSFGLWYRPIFFTIENCDESEIIHG